MVESVLPYMLAKTQHRYHAIRYCALQCITDLVRDDYLKLRGSILIYMLAALIDPHAATAEIAFELLLKYTAERNEILLRSCLLECPFVLNSYSYHENLDMFGGNAAANTDVNLPKSLLGNTMRTNRERIYRFFVMRIESVHCYMYFENFHMITDKIKHDPLIRSANGLSAVQDILFILTEICRAKEKRARGRKTADGSGDEDNDGEGVNSEETPPTTSATTAQVVAAKGGRGGAGKRGPTIEQALSVVEKVIPTIATLDRQLREINKEIFGTVMDVLCTAICDHFPALTDLALPQKFWTKYRRQRTRATPKKTNKQKEDDDESSSDGDAEVTPQLKNKTKKPTERLEAAVNEDDDEFIKPSATTTPRRQSRRGANLNETILSPGDDVASVQSDSESENDRDHRKVRLARKRLSKK